MQLVTHLKELQQGRVQLYKIVAGSPQQRAAEGSTWRFFYKAAQVRCTQVTVIQAKWGLLWKLGKWLESAPSHREVDAEWRPCTCNTQLCCCQAASCHDVCQVSALSTAPLTLEMSREPKSWLPLQHSFFTVFPVMMFKRLRGPLRILPNMRSSVIRTRVVCPPQTGMTASKSALAHLHCSAASWGTLGMAYMHAIPCKKRPLN